MTPGRRRARTRTRSRAKEQPGICHRRAHEGGNPRLGDERAGDSRERAPRRRPHRRCAGEIVHPYLDGRVELAQRLAEKSPDVVHRCPGRGRTSTWNSALSGVTFVLESARITVGCDLQSYVALNLQGSLPAPLALIAWVGRSRKYFNRGDTRRRCDPGRPLGSTPPNLLGCLSKLDCWPTRSRSA